MPDPHTFLYSWLRDGSEMWLAGNDWLEVQLEHLYTLAEILRPGATPATRQVGGRYVSATASVPVRVHSATGQHGIPCGRS